MSKILIIIAAFLVVIITVWSAHSKQNNTSKNLNKTLNTKVNISAAEIPYCQTPVVRALDKSKMLFCGEINSSSLSEARRILLEGSDLREVLVTSEGGDGSAAMQLVQLFNEHDIYINFQHYCLSACAHFIFVGAENYEISTGTFVGFHQTASSQLRVLTALGGNSESAAARPVRDRADQEQLFYELNNIDNQLLFDPIYQLSIECAQMPVIRDGALMAIPLKAKGVLWTPDKHSMERYLGRSLVGFWPNTRFEFLRNIPEHFRVSDSVTPYLFGPQRVDSAGVAEKVEFCG
ncbi:MAG: hypothetical protein AAFX02_04960 [Pseudomonadota bacterium]